MERVYAHLDQGVPVYIYSGCSHCSSTWGTSLCEVKNRGCCWYYPKFTLIEIHRMTKTLEGLLVLGNIRHHQQSVTYKYSIHSKGFFDKEKYELYIKNGQVLENTTIEDHSLFFKACPFVKSGHGCTIPYRYRSYVCNFFMCKDITDQIINHQSFNSYIDERNRYVRWLEWENASIRHILNEKGVNLVDDFIGTIEALQDMPLSNYEFPELEPIEIADIWPKGA